ncbi:Uncharacterised protein [Pseudomonas aeruginosa]|nr:Uncharacterised protein [Pseudomonas aeruginosa]
MSDVTQYDRACRTRHACNPPHPTGREPPSAQSARFERRSPVSDLSNRLARTGPEACHE